MRTTIPTPQWSINLRQARRAHGFTQAGFAELFGVSQQTVAKWELGYFEPPLAVIAWLVSTGATLA